MPLGVLKAKWQAFGLVLATSTTIISAPVDGKLLVVRAPEKEPFVLQVMRRVVVHESVPTGAVVDWTALNGESETQQRGIGLRTDNDWNVARTASDISRGSYMVKPGRSKGTSFFGDRDEFLEAISAAVQALRRTGQRPTREKVATYFGQTGLPGHPRCNARQLHRWLKVFGFLSWMDLIVAVDKVTPRVD